jgi:hypothetical protein
MDENLRFKFFAGLFIGVPQKEYDNEKYICVEDLGIERNTWEERFSSLQKFVNENRRLPNAKGGDQEVKLNRFMNIQINKANKGDLDNERISLILALASKYNYKKRKRDTPKTWDESYSLVREFVQKYQRLPIANDEDEKSIYQFFYRQRKLYLEHNLPLNFIDRFLEIANLLNDKI